MQKIGVTGGIGSGKSTVCRIFETMKIPVYYADLRARRLIEKDERIIQGYKKLFGDEAYDAGILDRNFVAGKVFADPSLLRRVNELVHPVVREDFKAWIAIQEADYVIQEAAVLLESGGYKTLDKVILVSAPKELRLSRVIQRDRIDKERVKERMKNQWTDEQRRLLCDYEVIADDEHLIVPQVLNIHNELIK
ncbi:dephospho-CoA kinase [Marinilabilia rubra]|uniref:Dephospho-CoA kinase n=1 Tax=Marinilabilia rubra TaxID=2162893 RepID=A0A2U2B3R5_9BACT|nr:dephospho-CoA kinase [Marinilabilia rubra]PWD97699.1 dephospho-CoA kinase [Marinilabilia rubra]